jgi:hypothetical protein
MLSSLLGNQGGTADEQLEHLFATDSLINRQQLNVRNQLQAVVDPQAYVEKYLRKLEESKEQATQTFNMVKNKYIAAQVPPSIAYDRARLAGQQHFETLMAIVELDFPKSFLQSTILRDVLPRAHSRGEPQQQIQETSSV